MRKVVQEGDSEIYKSMKSENGDPQNMPDNIKVELASDKKLMEDEEPEPLFGNVIVSN